jgi:hypothetical protein
MVAQPCSSLENDRGRASWERQASQIEKSLTPSVTSTEIVTSQGFEQPQCPKTDSEQYHMCLLSGKFGKHAAMLRTSSAEHQSLCSTSRSALHCARATATNDGYSR